MWIGYGCVGGDEMLKKISLIGMILIGITILPVWADRVASGRVFTENPITSLDSGWLPDSLKVSPDSNKVGYIVREQGSEFAVINRERHRKYQDIQDDMLYFSPNSLHVAYIAQQGRDNFLVLDGVEQQSYQDIKKKSFIFSEDGQHYAYIAKANGKWLVVHDGVEGEAFDDIGTSTLKLSLNGIHLFYAAQKDGQWILVVDGKAGKAYDGIRSIACDPEGRRFAAVVRVESQFAVVTGEKTSRPYEMIRANSLRFSPDGSRLAYIARSQGKEVAVVDDVAGKMYDQIGAGGVIFSPDSRRFGYTAKIGGHWTVVVDRQESPWYNDVMEDAPVFSPNSKKVAYAAKIGEQWSVIMNGTAGAHYRAIGSGTLTFSPDSSHLAYVGRKKNKWLVITDGTDGRYYDDIGRESLTFSPDGRHLAYSARRGDHWFIVLDGTEGRSYHNIITGFSGKISFTASGFKYKALQGYSILGVNERLLDKKTSDIDEFDRKVEKIPLKQYTFRFNPPSGTRFIATQHTTATLKADKYAEAGFDFEQNIKTEYLVTKTKDGFNIKVQFIDFEQKSNKQNINLELGSILKNTYFTIFTDPQGHFLRIDGIDNYYKKLQANIPHEVLEKNKKLFSKKGLEESFKNGWEGSIGDFVGKSFKLGDAWTIEDKVMLPNQVQLNCSGTLTFADVVRQNNRDLVRMTFEGTFDKKAIENYYNELGKANAVNFNTKLDTKLSGEILMDPETMLHQSNNMVLIMKMALDTPKGQANAALVMQMKTNIECL